MPSDVRRTVETYIQACDISKEDRAAPLAHGRSRVRAQHYEHADLSEQKLRALRLVEEWVCGAVIEAPSAPQQERRLRAVA